MHLTIHLIQIVLGAAFTLGLLGWCLYRLAVLFGIIIVKKRTKPARRPTKGNQTGQAGKSVSTQGQKKTATPISREILYTARPKRG